MTLKKVIERLNKGEDLDSASMQASIQSMLRGEVDETEIADFSIALSKKGETTEEIVAAVKAMRDSSPRVEVPNGSPLIDTCGTGGDGLSTFNVSTVVAIVVAACGYRVVKHGNRGVSSRTGSADLVQELGVNLFLSRPQVALCLEQVGLTFLFAPEFHPALHHVAPVRKKLGVRLFWNLLGPLANPAHATHQLLGVYDAARVVQMAEVLRSLDVKRAWVVHGEGGYDEIAPRGETFVAELSEGKISTRKITPSEFGLPDTDPRVLAGGDAQQNARITHEILGDQPDERRDFVVLNAAAALYVAGYSNDLRACAQRALHAIESGDAAKLLERWIEWSRKGV